MALRHNTGGVSTIDTKMATSEVTNVRSNTTDLTNEAYKAVSAVGNYVRNVTDSLLEVLMDIAIGDVCDFNEMNYQFMQRLMYLNDNEIAITLKNVGSSAALYGDSTSFTSERQAPSYAQARNYIDNYAKTVTARENSGVDSTRKIGIGAYNGNVNNYVNHGQLYRTVENLFPDELDSGSGRYGGKWDISSCMDSTLRKTKELFRMNKINTIISAFHTKSTTPESMGDARSKYGLSHGRNLLTKTAETSGGAYPINGYDNPYCRVWTHHYQYDRLDKLIRPFYVAEDSERKVTHVISLKKFHEWENFEGETGNEKWGWKSKSNDGWNYSVLGDNGFVNIAPKYLGGGAKNVHPKQCMFSIENLAWQGFSPYAFEKNLSWEQRGPLGGRIMWFPPYGLSFTEATTANWQPHTFIGRGEDVYTYTNTKRTGTLSFTLVVDHPSIVDYVTWSNNDTVSDTDLLRFFAGCEDDSKGQKTLRGESTTVIGDSGTLRDKVVPTPLTDEYLQIETFDDIEEEEAEPQEVQPEEIAEYIAISFCVFYPNNYAGYYDQPGSDVEAIAYLLAGEGAQKDSTDTSAHPKDVKISFAKLNESSGPGYEMLASTGDRGRDDSGITRPASDISQVGGNYIQGTSASWDSLTSYKDGGTGKRWYYRIDGEYSYPKTTKDKALNTYDQNLTLNKDKKTGVSQNYRDWRSYGLNCSAEEVKQNNILSEDRVTENNATFDNKVVSLAEVAWVLAKNSKVRVKVLDNGLAGVNEDNMGLLMKVFGYTATNEQDNVEAEYEIDHTTIVGVANNHGTNASDSVNYRRNKLLAENRGNTVKLWLESLRSDLNITVEQNLINEAVSEDVSDEKPKIERRAEVRIFCKKTSTTPVSETDQTESTVDEATGAVYADEASCVTSLGYTRSRVVDGVQYYHDPSATGEKANEEWYYDEATQQLALVEYKDVLDRTNYGKFRANKGEESEGGNGVTAGEGEAVLNRLRFDQEYHFFKLLEQSDPIVFDKLKEKLRVFDPAFHSQTPESFNSRLTFLAQCLRQGPTVGASDTNATSANNLAFGRPPVCVLRLGDFFNCKIIPENLSIAYEPLVWDLNTEGTGVQPMIAKVSLTFSFIGGSDIRGAITRLQNAASFNYYANASLYDNRADRVYRNYSQETNGSLDHEIIADKSTFYDPQMQNS